MNSEITQEQIDFYQENGFVVIDNFLDADELETWRANVDDAVAKRRDLKLVSQGKDSREWKAGNSYYDRVFVQRINLWQDHDGMRELILDPRIGKMATELAQVDGMRIWHDQALNKQPWANPTGWHLDNPYWSYHSRAALSIWVALDDATLQNGCLYFVPGSHKVTSFENSKIGENLGDLFEIYPELNGIMPVPAEMKAGSCSFHNGLAAHGAGPNMTPGWRRAMTCGFMPDGSTFNGTKNILSDEQIGKLEIGDVMDDDKQNPLLYHRSKPSLATALKD
ncbi:MAG: phytanoyl-CoA dioxygenase family protein [Chloroflexota bacterium]